MKNMMTTTNNILILLCIILALVITLLGSFALQASASSPVLQAPVQPDPVVTRAYNNARTGARLTESILNATNVNVRQFGKLFSRRVTGHIYAQPLYVPNLFMKSTGKRHDVLFVATMANNMYAFDANNPDIRDPLWHRNFGSSVAMSDNVLGTSCGTYRDIYIEVGIVSTPVIDLTRNIMFFTTLNKDSQNPIVLKHRLHAIDMTTGEDRIAPVIVEAQVQGNGAGSQNGVLRFNTPTQLQRSALLLHKGIVFMGFGTYCFTSPWHGWLLGYDSQTLEQKFVLCTTPNDEGGSVWMGGSGPAADESFIYFATGNGQFDQTRNNYGDSFVKLDPNNKIGGNGLYKYVAKGVTDYFTPKDQLYMYETDMDFATSGVLLIPGTDLAMVCSKAGDCYVVNRSNMGGYGANIVQQFRPAPDTQPIFYNGVHSCPVAWDSPTKGKLVYTWPSNDRLRALHFIQNGKIGLFNQSLTEVSQVATSSYPGGILTLSALGSSARTGIVWASHPANGNANHEITPGILRAFDAEDVTKEIWNSNMNAQRDNVGSFAKFNPPIVANGRVYLATFSTPPDSVSYVHVYGLLNQPKDDPCRLSGCFERNLGCCIGVCYNITQFMCVEGVVQVIPQPPPPPPLPSPSPTLSPSVSPSPGPNPSSQLPVISTPILESETPIATVHHSLIPKEDKTEESASSSNTTANLYIKLLLTLTSTFLLVLLLPKL